MCLLWSVDVPPGSANQKGTVMGILRSLGALARALGPVVASSGEEDRRQDMFYRLMFCVRVIKICVFSPQFTGSLELRSVSSSRRPCSSFLWLC